MWMYLHLILVIRHFLVYLGSVIAPPYTVHASVINIMYSVLLYLHMVEKKNTQDCSKVGTAVIFPMLFL